MAQITDPENLNSWGLTPGKLVAMTGLSATAVLLDTVGNSESFIICLFVSGFEFYFS